MSSSHHCVEGCPPAAWRMRERNAPARQTHRVCGGVPYRRDASRRLPGQPAAPSGGVRFIPEAAAYRADAPGPLMMMVEDSSMGPLTCAGRASQTASSERIMMEATPWTSVLNCMAASLSVSRRSPFCLSTYCTVILATSLYRNFIENGRLVQKKHPGINRAATHGHQRQLAALAGVPSPQTPHNQARRVGPTSTSPRLVPAATPARRNNTRNCPWLESFRGLERAALHV